MKRIIGFLLISVGIGLVASVTLAYVSWATAVATRLLLPVFLIGAAVILVIIGIYLRGDK